LSGPMELAVHLRNVDQKDGLDKWREHLAGLYGDVGVAVNDWVRPAAPTFDRIYVGDEFCFHRLPRLTELKALLQLARENGMAVTLLTPVLTDDEMRRISPLLDCLHECHGAAEVVFNDWGVLHFLKERYPDFSLAAGRLLNKGFKDPRLPAGNNLSPVPAETEALLNSGSFDHAELQEKMVELGVIRMERDMLPYGKPPPLAASALKTSVYFPFGYVTTGRICWMATFSQPTKQKFVPMKECARPCERGALRLDADGFSFPMIQGGNTVYYLYTQAMLATIMEEAGRERLRLVYQGFAV